MTNATVNNIANVALPAHAGGANSAPPPAMPAIPVDAWLQQLDMHYLKGFILAGGAAVKFVIAMDTDATDLCDAIEDRAREQGYVIAAVSATETRVHMMDQLFHAVCRQIPWRQLCEERLLRLVNGLGYEPPCAGAGSFLTRLADANNLTTNFLSLPLRRQIQDSVYRERSLARDFRVAMTHLCLAALDDAADDAPFTDLLAWLTGSQTGANQIKPYQIFARINRHSARHLFESLTHWIAQCGRTGLLVTIDTRRLLEPRRVATGVNYSKANAMDTYEVLRQFIDSAERLSHCLLTVVADARFLQPEGKGIELYQALKYRVYDEVHDKRRANPLGSLVRLREPATTAAAGQHPDGHAHG